MSVLLKKIEFYKGESDCEAIIIVAGVHGVAGFLTGVKNMGGGCTRSMRGGGGASKFDGKSLSQYIGDLKQRS